MAHTPVLLKEVIDGLSFDKSDKIFVDATVGFAGHSIEVCQRFPWVRIIGLDTDSDAVASSREKMSQSKCRFEAVTANFRNIGRALDEMGVKEIDKILFDIGMSSMQLDSSGRGFSFRKDEPLLMTMKKEISANDLTAFEIVNSWPKDDIAAILKEYGEEGFFMRIADSITRERKKHPISTTFDLVKIIESSVPSFYKKRKISPATKTFQALRIAVNDELNSLKMGLKDSFERLRTGGRIAVISFHSLEDRIVKNFFKEMKINRKAIQIFKKPVTASREEIKVNPRARSAKLRIVEKL